MNKATCRALRERLGLSQANVADIAEVSTETVKNWENPARSGSYPVDVLDELLNMLEAAYSHADEVTDRVIGEFSGVKRVSLAYWRNQAEHDALAAHPGFFGYVNMQARICADMLEAEGFEVMFEYPGDGGAATLANVRNRLDSR